jgi:hypothetical protein
LANWDALFSWPSDGARVWKNYVESPELMLADLA